MWRARRDSRGFGLLLFGYGVSAYGSYLNLIALGLFSYHLTGSSLATGAVMAIRLASGFVTGLVAGGVLNRVSRRPLLIGFDLLQAVVMVILVLAPSLLMLLLVAVTLGVGNTTLVVALRSSVPDMVGPDERVRANGRLVTARSLATVLGFGSAGLLIDLGGYDTAFLINAGSFLVSALALSFVTLPGPVTGQAADGDGGDDRDGVRRSPWRMLPPLIAGLIVLRGVDALASAGHNVALPIFASGTAPDNPAALMAQFMTAWAIGSLGAHQFVSRVLKDVGHRAFALATCLMSVCFVLAFTGLPTAGLIIVCFLAGIADGITEIGYVSSLQTTPSVRRSRVFGLAASVENSAFGFGMLAAAALLEVLPALPVVAAFHGLAVTGALVFLLHFWRRTHHASLDSPVDQSRPPIGADRD